MFSGFTAAMLKMTLILALQLLNDNNLAFDDCRDGNAKSCEQTIRYLKDSCRNKGAKSCGVRGYIYESGIGVSVNVKNAIEYYKKS